MARDCKISQHILERQQTMFRVACDPLRYGNTLKSISLASDIPYSTLRSYAEGSAEMPLSALYKLADVVPDELLSLLAPEGRMLVRVPENVDHDEADKACRDFSATKAAAHHPESEAGRDIGPNEDKLLRSKLTVIQGSAAA